MIALTSVTFRAMSASQVISAALDAGIRAIEWGGDVHVPAGDTACASDVKKMCDDNGVAVSSYGTYFGLLSAMDISPWLDSAQALAAKDIRIWAGNFRAMRGSYSEGDLTAAVEELCEVCREAFARGITVHLEKHRGTLTQSPKTACQLIDRAAAPNLRSYWQPNPELTVSDNAAAIRTLGSRISKVHVFNWTPANERLPLSEGCRDWKTYLEALGSRDFILEFVRGNSPEQLSRDAQTLRDWLTQEEGPWQI